MIDRRVRVRLVGVLLAAVVLAGVVIVGPDPGRAAHAGLTGHIYAGTCEDLPDQPAVELDVLGHTNPVLSTPVGTPPADVITEGPPEVYPAVSSTTVVDLSLDDLLARPHAIGVSLTDESGEEILLACGNVGGVVRAGDLVFGLRSVTANTTGIAWLHALDGRTRVVLFVAQSLGPTPAATPNA